MKKIIVFILFSFFFLITINFTSASISIKPHEISINIENNFIQGNTTKKITVENINTNIYNVTWYIEHPYLSKIRENRTFISNLSWVDLEPKWKIIPSNEKIDFYIYTDIPKEEKNLDKHWEVWVTFKEGKQNKQNKFFNFEHAIRVYIDTPKSFMKSGNNNIFTDQNNGLFGISIEDIQLKEIGLIILAVILISAVFLHFIKKRN